MLEAQDMRKKILCKCHDPPMLDTYVVNGYWLKSMMAFVSQEMRIDVEQYVQEC